MSEDLIAITGRNALEAVGISLLVVFLVSTIYSLMAMFLYADQIATNGISVVFGHVISIVYVVMIFVGAPTWVIGFALLQRFKIRY